MRYDKEKYGEYLIGEIKDKFPNIRGLEYQINKENVSLNIEHGSVPSQELNSFMTWLRLNDPIVQGALRLDKEKLNTKIEINGYLGLAILFLVSLIILSMLIII